jgi:hypothetical protein
MITNETRAKLIGLERGYHGWERNGRLVSTSFDTDANAVAELRTFVRARGKEIEFAKQLSGFDDEPPSLFSVCFDVFIDATPQQQTAAFDATFKDDLERINET